MHLNPDACYSPVKENIHINTVRTCRNVRKKRYIRKSKKKG